MRTILEAAQKALKTTYVCFLCRAAKLDLTELYWPNFPLTSLSMLTSSCAAC